jgi:hypothetical protein
MPETVGRATPIDSASARVSIGPQTHTWKSVENPAQLRSCRRSTLRSRCAREAWAARKTFEQTAIAPRSTGSRATRARTSASSGTSGSVALTVTVQTLGS